MMRPDEPVESSAELQRAVRDAMVYLGWIPPTTEAEFAQLEKRLKDEPVDLPPELAAIEDPLDAPCSERHPTSDTLRLPCSDTQQNLARVAREGGDLSPDVIEQMRRDRAAAEEQADGR